MTTAAAGVGTDPEAEGSAKGVAIPLGRAGAGEEADNEQERDSRDSRVRVALGFWARIASATLEIVRPLCNHCSRTVPALSKHCLFTVQTLFLDLEKISRRWARTVKGQSSSIVRIVWTVFAQCLDSALHRPAQRKHSGRTAFAQCPGPTDAHSIPMPIQTKCIQNTPPAGSKPRLQLLKLSLKPLLGPLGSAQQLPTCRAEDSTWLVAGAPLRSTARGGGGRFTVVSWVTSGLASAAARAARFHVFHAAPLGERKPSTIRQAGKKSCSNLQNVQRLVLGVFEPECVGKSCSCLLGMRRLGQAPSQEWSGLSPRF
jgi:hypothetical protein